MDVTILAIESSCDETSASVLHNGVILSNIIATQAIHESYGGVVPELASREHQKNIVPVVSEALRKANVPKNALHAVGYTQGPGLLGSLLVGGCFAKSFAYGLGIPLIEVNHMQAHILAHFIDDPKPKFPFLCLTISGGHTQIVQVDGPLDMKIIGQSQDDAVGEAFDKSAKLLGLPYPGGPLVDKFAQLGDPFRFKFPSTQMPDLDYSFSGIKTAILNFLNENKRKDASFIEKNLNDICAGIQHTLVNMLFQKLLMAAERTGIKEIAIAGGVSANLGVRKRLKQEGELQEWNTYIPEFQYCTDNAAMIAIAAYFQYVNGNFATIKSVPNPRLHF